MVKQAEHPIRIDLNEFKLHLQLKPIHLTLHFDSPSRKFYLCLLALIVHEMKRLGKITTIPLEGLLDQLVLLNETIGGSAGSSDKKKLFPRIYRKWKNALPNLEEAPLFKVLGRRKKYGEGAGKVYSFSEAEKDGWANLFEYQGSEEEVKLKFAVHRLGMTLDSIVIEFGEPSKGDPWDRFISNLKRPPSAERVGKPLPTENAEKTEAVSISSSEPLAQHPFFRRVFVGREPELKHLQSVFDLAWSGQGSLIMVAGEPGIGKTTLTEQLAHYVRLRGGQALVGHCYDKGSPSLPYLAFVEPLRSYSGHRDLLNLKEELGSNASDVARIVPEIGQKLRIQRRSKRNSEEEKYLLMQAVTGFLGNIAEAKPLALILEDLHNADQGTLEMLTHVNRSLGNKRLLVIGTYRDIEVGRIHPLSSALAELKRLPHFSRILLKGLKVDEIQRLLSGTVGQEVSRGLAERVHRQTEGNPLFAQEVGRYLLEEGLLVREDGTRAPVKDLALEMSIPEGLKEVIGKRLCSLSDECNKLLSMASVIGFEFSLEVLQKLSAVPEEVMFKELDEALKAAIIEERTKPGGLVYYCFTHAFFHQALYEEIMAPLCIRFHRQVARALEEIFRNRPEEHAAELAGHFAHSSDPADLAKAVSYGEMGAQRAIEVYAYGEAVRLMDLAIRSQEFLDPDNKAKRCDLLLDLCETLNLAAEPKRVLETEAPTAFALAETLGDDTRASRSCRAALIANYTERSATGWSTPLWKEWAERADRHAGLETHERAFADMALGAYAPHKPGILPLRRKLLIQALALARKLNDLNTLWMAGWVLLTLTSPQRSQESLLLAEELWAGSRLGLNTAMHGGTLQMIGHTYLALGLRQRAEEVFEELRTLARYTGQYVLGIKSAGSDALLMLMDGYLEKVLASVQNIRSSGAEAGVPQIANIDANLPGVRARIYLGSSGEDLDRLQAMYGPDDIRQVEPQLCLILSHLGRRAEVLELLERRVTRWQGIGTPGYESMAWHDSFFLEAAVIIGHRQAAEVLLNRFAGTEVYTSGIFYPTCNHRHLGGAAALLGRFDEARGHYRKAISVCTEMRFRPELALTRFQLAELLLEQYPKERAEALEHLSFAVTEFREMNMQPALNRALNYQDILKPKGSIGMKKDRGLGLRGMAFSTRPR
jgi:tetratricopeptide (TPR) repeat protein